MSNISLVPINGKFKPGQSGNPTGRRKTGQPSLADLLRKELPTAKLAKELVALALDSTASAQTRLACLRLIADHTAGLPTAKAPEATEPQQVQVKYATHPS